MNSFDLIDKYYIAHPQAKEILIAHSERVCDKALEAAGRVMHLNPDLEFIKEAALLHDIGMFMTNAPGIGCHGEHPYITHGCLGSRLLTSEGLPRHALVAERHVGVGLRVEDIIKNNFPLPLRDMIPETIEEQIVCFADKFFSKGDPKQALSIEKARSQIERYGEAKLIIFDSWLRLFKYRAFSPIV